MNKITLNYRANQLKVMHEFMCLANDEELYASWIVYMPDGATEQDFIDIAEDDDLYKDIVKSFKRLVQFDEDWSY